MKIQDLLLGRKCGCGKEHTCDIENVIIKTDAVEETKRLAAEYNNILVVADNNTYPLCGDWVLSLLSDKTVKTVIFETEGPLVPNEDAVKKAEEGLTDKTDLIIGIGSGVIQDLCKYVSFTHGFPYFIIATAPSMDGYASVGAAMIFDGMKVTVSAHTPKAIICDINILKDAPLDMIKAGYGDILGKFSCLNDWKLSHLVNDEYYCDYVADLTYEMLYKTKDLGQKLLERDGYAVMVLTEALIGVGVAMSYVGNSRPASGSEHHMSHFFEIVGLTMNEPYFMHGIDVVFSAFYTAKVREEILNMKKPSGRFTHSKEAWESEIKRVYTSSSDGVIALQERTGFYNKDRIAVYREKWDDIIAVLGDAPSSLEMAEYIKSVGLDISDFDKEYGRKKINDALLYAKDLKDRYSVLWMYYDMINI